MKKIIINLLIIISALSLASCNNKGIKLEFNSYEVTEELSSYLNEKVPRKIITNREEAINVAIKGLGKRDALLITGRGNRALLCDGENHIRLLKDSDVLRKALKVLNKVKGE